jgi:hypothetical protein
MIILRKASDGRSAAKAACLALIYQKPLHFSVVVLVLVSRADMLAHPSTARVFLELLTSPNEILINPREPASARSIARQDIFRAFPVPVARF